MTVVIAQAETQPAPKIVTVWDLIEGLTQFEPTDNVTDVLQALQLS